MISSPKYVLNENSSTPGNVVRGENVYHRKRSTILTGESTVHSLFLGFSFLHPYQHFSQWNQGKTMRGDKTTWNKRTVLCIYYFTEQRMLAKGAHYSSYTKAEEGRLTWKHLSKTIWHFWGEKKLPGPKKKKGLELPDSLLRGIFSSVFLTELACHARNNRQCWGKWVEVIKGNINEYLLGVRHWNGYFMYIFATTW